MSATPVFAADRGLEPEERIERARRRLFDLASDLTASHLPTHGHRAERLSELAAELHQVEETLQLVVHIERIEAQDIEDQVVAIESRMNEGWVPPARPAADVVQELRAKFGS